MQGAGRVLAEAREWGLIEVGLFSESCGLFKSKRKRVVLKISFARLSCGFDRLSGRWCQGTKSGDADPYCHWSCFRGNEFLEILPGLLLLLWVVDISKQID